MILYDVICSNDHVFEAWFADSKAFEDQRKDSAIVCPMCGDTHVEKALMAPNISAKKEQATADGKDAADAMRFLYKMREHIEENCDYVGKDFAEEARKIYYGEKKYHPIRGETTPEEANDLEEEGVPFARMPWNSKEDA